ncbi:hypothetical protein Spith_0690 [Spirochaeta thermophila DSM 6578]|uniref:HD Cas3-type domain-containing protein n=1 Tax=Winmispira thermophila (strain ATCC 700085 / DSM 6578 / Z-1203) TaxID=869211 RepID=G0GAK4_WINT7|nr:HD domain-containing protein [Spirochaeta thermophila]AEJ60969.1 hypothetical protein Spith_0690 [Spirochaeta thermophila DSM 6578]
MLIREFKSKLGKSSKGGQTLYEHVMDCTKIAYTILTDGRFMPTDYPKQKRDQLFFSVFMHDLGKLNPDFQKMLEAARSGKPLPTKRVKHEASTLELEVLLRENVDDVCQHLENEFGYQFSGSIDNLDDTLAFAVTHHGLFYLSFEQRGNNVVPRVRREWTVFNYGEQRRITLTDLLFDYHPLGGLVIISDLLGSFSYEQGIADVDSLLNQAGSLRELIDGILEGGVVEAVEKSIRAYDPRTYGLRNLLALLGGGLN